jgi:NTE family protein
MGLLDLTLEGGLIKGDKLTGFFRSHFQDKDITEMAKAYGAVATELVTGREIWLREGSVIDSVRASSALPGLFTPILHGQRLLVDGGLVNPVPVSLCRAMGADIVIAVDLNWDLVGRRYQAPSDPLAETVHTAPAMLTSMLGRLPFAVGRLKSGPKESTDMPSMLDVLAASLDIMQVRITRSRLAGEPADVMIRPHLSNIALMDFHRAAEAIAEGRRAAGQMLPQLGEVMGWRIHAPATKND